MNGSESKAEIVPWLGSLQAIPVTKGVSTVKLRYRPPAFVIGAWISGIAWCILLVSLVGSLFRKRERVHPNDQS